jgi:hypothetical protein
MDHRVSTSACAQCTNKLRLLVEPRLSWCRLPMRRGAHSDPLQLCTKSGGILRGACWRLGVVRWYDVARRGACTRAASKRRRPRRRCRRRARRRGRSRAGNGDTVHLVRQRV